VSLGCRVCRTVAVAAQVTTTRVILVVNVPWAGTVRAVSSPLVRSCRGVSAADVRSRHGGAQGRGALDQVQDGSYNRICKWFDHLIEFFSAFLAYVSSGDVLFGL
jgi:hypothetical protein